MEHDARCELKNEYIGVPRWANTCRCQERALEVDLAAVGAAMQAVQEEKDALRLRVAALQGYIALARNHLHSQDEQARTNATTLLDSAGDTTALRAMLVEAALGGIGDDQNMPLDPRAKQEIAEAIADRILGASKGGGE